MPSGVVEKCGVVHADLVVYCTNIITTKSRLNKHCQCDKLIGLTPGRNVMKVGKTFQPGLLSTCEGGFQGTLMVLLDTMGRFNNRNSLNPLVILKLFDNAQDYATYCQKGTFHKIKSPATY